MTNTPNKDMPSRLPVIGISARLLPSGTSSPGNTVGVSENYVQAVEAARGAPLLLPLMQSSDALAAIAERLDGLLFSGGEDLSPSHYHETAHPKLGEVSTSRDSFELQCFHLAMAKRLPILGICRGLQLINVALGGTLYQDLPTQRPSAVAHLLPEDADLPISASTHHIKIAAESQLSRILGTASIRANSRHHQAVKSLGQGLIANAWSDDDVIEGFELPSPSQFLLGVQCHPERIWNTTVPAWKTVFEALVAAGRSYSERRFLS